jgi:hypothetical protein
MPPRAYRYVGPITDETPIFNTTFGHFNKLLSKEFLEQIKTPQDLEEDIQGNNSCEEKADRK